MVELLTSALEWSWLAQISYLTRPAPSRRPSCRRKTSSATGSGHSTCRIRSAITTGWAECSGCGCSARSGRMRSTSDDLQRTHSAVLVGSSQRDGAELRQASIKRVEVRISVQQCDTVPSRDDRDEAINQATHGVSPSATSPIDGGRGVEVQAHID